MELDPRTFIFTTTLAAFVMMIVFSAQARSFPESIQGYRTWGFALFIATFASVLISVRDMIPYAFSVVLGNGFLGLSISLMVAAVSIFLDRPIPWKLLSVCVAFIMLGMIYPLAPEHAQQLRTVFAVSGNIVLLSMLAWVAISGRHVLKFRFGVYFTSICAGTTALVCLARLVTLLAGSEEHTGLLTESPMQRIYLATYSLNVLLVSVGFSIMGHEKLVENYHALASHDELTGLYNRRRFTETAEHEIHRAQRYERDISLILIDIDDFKAINDIYGHQGGDTVIKDIADVMRQNFRETDLYGRYGGEEFIVLLPETQLPDAAALSERMRGALIQRVVKFESKEITYTASFGVTHGEPGMQLDQLVGQADKALYHAKHSGRNRVELFPVEALAHS